MYVDQEFIKKWKKWILDIARFETTATTYAHMIMLPFCNLLSNFQSYRYMQNVSPFCDLTYSATNMQQYRMIA